jgi:hypothetical protein
VGRALDADVEVAVKDVAELDIRQRRRIATQKPTRVEAPPRNIGNFAQTRDCPTHAGPVDIARRGTHDAPAGVIRSRPLATPELGLIRQQQRETRMALFVGLDVSLKTVSICIAKADGSVVWEGKALSEPASLIKALARRRRNIQLVGIEACPLSEWLLRCFCRLRLHHHLHRDPACTAVLVIATEQDRPVSQT